MSGSFLFALTVQGARNDLKDNFVNNINEVKQEKFKPYNDVLDLIDEANRNKHGGDRKSENFKIVNHHLVDEANRNKHGANKYKDDVNNINVIEPERPQGNTKETGKRVV